MTINRLLAKNFDTVQKTFMRARVFQNGRAKEPFSLQRELIIRW
jgi:hypothetical protein